MLMRHAGKGRREIRPVIRPFFLTCGMGGGDDVMKPKIRYGILDAFGEVIRWQFTKPSSEFRYIRQRIKQPDLVELPGQSPF